jgi:eukaryotic-like serine/threonine-protein kinase
MSVATSSASAKPARGNPPGLPQRLGRYDIVGAIAHRPFATTLLGCLLDPTHGGGFRQRPVAIKRVAPELARKKEFVDAFLDVVRATTSVRHTNVVPILEVGHEADELFLVMEYLEGETCAAMMKRLHSRGETLDFTIAAYLAAEVCAGLHAAHEAGIVHEHLDPAQIFIGYDGAVRVLDLGVAAVEGKFAPRLVRGARNLQYASPERCRGETLDRRSDVFSMGAILWELTSGMSAFDRVGEADVIRAICEEEIPAPSTVVRGLPEQISMITMQALARPPDERFPTTLALRRELLGVVRLLAIGVSPSEDLGQLLRRLFDDRVAAKAEMLRRVQVGADITDLAIGDEGSPGLPSAGALPVESSIEAPPAPAEVREPSVLVEPSIADPSAPKPPRPASADETAPRRPVRASSQGKRLLFAALLGVVAALAVIVTIVVGQKADGARPPASSVVVKNDPPPSATSAPTPVASPAPTPTPTPTPTPAPEPSETVTAAVGASDQTTTVHLETSPAKATIYVNNTKKGVSPFDLKLTKSSEPVIIEIRHPGYQTLKERVVPDMNQKLKLTLAPAHGAPPAPAPAASSVPYHRFD